MKVLRLDGGANDVIRMAEHFGGTNAEASSSQGLFSAREKRFSFDNALMRGSASSFNLRPDVHLGISDLQGRQAMRFPIQHSPTGLEFCFSRSPGMSARGPNGEDLTLAAGEFQVCTLREETRLHLEAESGALERSVRLNLTPAALHDLLGTSTLPEQVGGILSESGAYSTRSYAEDRVLSNTIDALLEAAQSNSSGRALYVQAKAMELLALACDRLGRTEEPVETVPVEQLQRLHQAREILMAQLEHPPSVQQLARQVHMGERQFKSGFKILFGAPVMTYARRLRMERAQKLLTARRHNVTEVASLLGYANPSKFAAAYRRQFGISPSAA